MELVDFINKYTKEKVDYDKTFGPQCTDLFRQYCQDVLQIPHTGSVDGARDLFINYSALPLEKKYFYRYSKSYKPKYGDIVVFDLTATNKYGHVAIVISQINSNSLLVFEQDGIKQDGAKFGIRKTDNILGYLRKK